MSDHIYACPLFDTILFCLCFLKRGIKDSRKNDIKKGININYALQFTQSFFLHIAATFPCKNILIDEICRRNHVFLLRYYGY